MKAFGKLLTIGAMIGAGYALYTAYQKSNEALEAELAGEFDDSELDEEIERTYSDIDTTEKAADETNAESEAE